MQNSDGHAVAQVSKPAVPRASKPAVFGLSPNTFALRIFFGAFRRGIFDREQKTLKLHYADRINRPSFSLLKSGHYPLALIFELEAFSLNRDSEAIGAIKHVNTQKISSWRTAWPGLVFISLGAVLARRVATTASGGLILSRTGRFPPMSRGQAAFACVISLMFGVAWIYCAFRRRDSNWPITEYSGLLSFQRFRATIRLISEGRRIAFVPQGTGEESPNTGGRDAA